MTVTVKASNNLSVQVGQKSNLRAIWEAPLPGTLKYRPVTARTCAVAPVPISYICKSIIRQMLGFIERDWRIERWRQYHEEWCCDPSRAEEYKQGKIRKSSKFPHPSHVPCIFCKAHVEETMKNEDEENEQEA